MSKERFIKNIIPQIERASRKTLTKAELEETANYIWLYKSTKCNEHYEVNNIITKNDTWDDFSSIRSLNDHGYTNKIKGITPQFFAIVCRVLQIAGADGNPLKDYEQY